MISLSERQKNDIGLRFVLDKLNTCTPYGAELVSKLTPFMPNEKERLILELDDVGRVKNGYNDLRLEIIGIFHTMSLFKDIRPMLGKCKNDNAYVLDEVELFELKNFLLSLKELCLLFNAAQKSLFLSSQLPIDMPYALAVLDPESSDLRTFYMPDQASARLSEIRAKKRRLEAEITAADNDEQKQILREQRFAVVCHEDDEGLCIRRELTRKLLSWHDEFIQNTIVIGHLDLLLQKGRLAAENETAHPTLSDSAVEFTDLYNPLTAYYLEKRGKRFTPVSIDLRRGTTILTGANMGGKSVVLKTLTLNIILFQMGFFVFAKQASLPMFNHIHLVSEDLQSPDKGLSTFAAEIIELRRITADLKRGFSFIALDEFARGTNPVEGATLARAVALYFNDKNAVSILTTHYEKVSSPEFCNYQVVGLKNIDFELLRQKIKLESAEPIQIIAERMDYSLQKVNADTELPKDALNICKLLNLSEDILCYCE